MDLGVMLRIEALDLAGAELALFPIFLHAVVTFHRNGSAVDALVRIESAHLPFMADPSGFATKRHNKSHHRTAYRVVS